MPAETTEFHDILVQKGIIPKNNEIEVTEDQIIQAVENAAEEKLSGHSTKNYESKTLKELDELSGDDEEEKIIAEYRKKRLLELKKRVSDAKFGDVREISADIYVAEVNQAGDNVWVLLLLYEDSVPLCQILQEYWRILAPKFPSVKFLKSVAHLCIPNFPAKNLPAVFVYFENDLKNQLIGCAEFSKLNSDKAISIDELEWKLHSLGAVKSTLKEDPSKKRHNITADRGILLAKKNLNSDSSDDDDW